VEIILYVFIFFYPLFMAVYWMTGAILFFNRLESRGQKPPKLKNHPKISIVVPCHNEQTSIRDAIGQLDKNNYPDFEIIAVNDGSTDSTGEILYNLSQKMDRLKVVNLTQNCGKAMALKSGVLASSAEFIMCIDADALLDQDALFWMIRHFQNGPRVGAVTGNPRVINKTNLLSRIQIGEFSAIIGMIKRTQREIGRIFTVSGVNACFRKSALHDVGYWSSETVTEDIDISWKLQLRYWDIRYEPQALTWILVPDTIKTLWAQRLRWAQGGFEAATKYWRDILKWKNRRMWIVSLEYWVTLLWCYALGFTFICFAGTHLAPEGSWPEVLRIQSMIPGWTGVALAVVCLIQFTVGLFLDGLYERRGLFRYLFWAIWYPVVFWLIAAATNIVAVPKGLMKKGKTRRAVWVSPTRKLLYQPVSLGDLRKKNQHRHFFRQIIPKTKKVFEATITIISWSLWVYLVTPLVSLGVWGLSAWLFMDRMITPGSYETFAKAANYTAIILTMWLLLAVWILWNRQRYGRRNRNRRKNSLPDVTAKQLSEAMGVSIDDITSIKLHNNVYLHYDENDAIVVENLENSYEEENVVAMNR